MVFHISAVALCVSPDIGVDAMTGHISKTLDCPGVRVQPHQKMRGFRRSGDEAPKSLRIDQIVDRRREKGFDRLRKADGIPNRKYRVMIANQIEYPVIRIKLGGKSAYVPGSVRGTPVADS